MRKRLLLAWVGLFLTAAPPLFAQETSMHQKEMKQEVKKSDYKAMKCEVVDVACYIAKGAKGEAHQGCAAKCISEGGELALLNDGKIYVPVDKDFHSARKRFVTLGGEKVNVMGKPISKDGINYLQLADVSK